MIVNEKEVKLKNGKLRKVTEEFTHSYWHDELGWVVGVTTVLGALPTPYGLKRYWEQNDPLYIEKTLQRASEHGTAVHQAIEQLNEDGTFDTSGLRDSHRADIASYIEWFRSWRPDNVQSEQVVFHEAPLFAGTVDMVFELDGKTCLLDIKTSNQVGISAFLQVAAYKEAYEQSYGTKIDELLVLQLGTAHKKINNRTPILDRPSNGVGWKVYHVDEEKYNYQMFQKVYDIFLMVNDGYPEPPKTVEYPLIFNLFEESESAK